MNLFRSVSRLVCTPFSPPSTRHSVRRLPASALGANAKPISYRHRDIVVVKQSGMERKAKARAVIAILLCCGALQFFSTIKF